MEQVNIEKTLVIPEQEIVKDTSSPFIKANTKNVSLFHLKEDCTIPVFSKDNECTIAHHEFINTVVKCVNDIFIDQNIEAPEIRTSHVIKGRVPDAIGKPVNLLTEQDKTIYYERMMFKIDIPNIRETINGNNLHLTVGGVRAYNQENLYSKKNFEKFKVFIGFKNMVCTNLCVSSDGIVQELRASNLLELEEKVKVLLGNYEMQKHLNALNLMSNYKLNEEQFAKFIGKCRMYNYLPKNERVGVSDLQLTDGQINNVVKSYYEDEYFKREHDGSISLWKLYNLFTGANKSSYIDSFLDRSVNSYEIIQKLSYSIHSGEQNWYLN
ncbi:MAG: hypothetical protein CMC05_01180 [Flavobacteriaceae bacterium]|nr:hypothetical protein [Flavobacteriaceae bacterium]MBD10509.1 hypothetical protein [Flavobacteriaceae bacterium]|tara:strand:+ start:7188 stop:8162 length:975 start_codon:yes stop_codon:yes gene_type:complete